MNDARFADTPFTQCEQGVSYGRKIRDATDAEIEVENGDPQRQRWFFDNSYTSQYVMHFGAYQTRTRKLQVLQRTIMQNPLFVGWHHLELFSVPPRERHHQHIQATLPRGKLEIHPMLCVPTLLMLICYSDAFCSGEALFSPLICNNTITEFVVMLIFCFIRTADFSVHYLFIPNRFSGLKEEGRSRVNKRVLIPLPRKVRSNSIVRDLLMDILDCEADPVASFLAFLEQTRSAEQIKGARLVFVRLCLGNDCNSFGTETIWVQTRAPRRRAA